MRPLYRTLLVSGLAGLASLSTLSAHADEKGEKILRDAFRKLYQARSMTAELLTERRMTGQPAVSGKGSVTLQKPNRLRVTLAQKFGARTIKATFVSDGKYYFNYQEGMRNYMREPVAAQPAGFNGQWEGEVDSFFGGEKIAAKVKADFAGTTTVDGVSCNLVRINEKAADRILTYAIGQQDRLIHRTSWTVKMEGNQSMTQTNTLRNIQLNGTPSSSLFAFNPPKGVKLYDPQEEIRQMEAKLVPPGEEAPAFEVTNPQNRNRFSLAKALDGRKAVLVNFWFYG